MTKRQLHEALEAHVRSVPGVPPAAYLVRWVVVREVVLPGTQHKALNFASGDASGMSLTLWDAEALLRGYLRELYERDSLTDFPPAPKGPQPPPPEDPEPF